MKVLHIRIAARAATQRNTIFSFSFQNFTSSSSASLSRSQEFKRLSPHTSITLFSTSTKDTTAPTSWVESSYVPSKIRPYLYLARVDKPVGTLLLLWPCCWSVALAAPLGAIPDLLLMSKFALGAFIMRGAGCTINDLWDQDFDRQVERTKSRPLASGQLTTNDGLRFLAMQLSAGLGVLLTFNSTSIAAGLMSMPLVISYPLMKRFTYWPQFVLGLTFNWGVWVGWTAIYDSVAYEQLLPLYGAGVCWTLVYDTIYGYQDRKDDAKIGVKSVPLYLGDRPQIPLSLISCGMLGGLLATGYIADLTAPFYVGTTGIWGHVLWQIWTADINNPQNLWKRFSSNIYTGAAVTAAIIAGHF